jgi:dTDP-4-dehydrorhamnose 3,5-epimerase
MNKIFGVKGNPIQGVLVKTLNRIPDERGSVMHMLKATDPEFNKFGEIYFSTIYPQAIKGWHIHTKMELNYAVVSGNVKLVLYDDRPRSKTRRNLMEIFMGDKNYCLVKIPPHVWNGFKGIGQKEAIIANCATLPHDPDEIKRLDPFSKKIPYTWDLIHG